MDQNFMFDDKLRQIESRLSEVEQSLGDPAQLTDSRNLMQLTKTHAELLPIVTTYKEFQKCQKDLSDAQTMVTEEVDLALQELAEDEVQILEKKLVELVMSMLREDPKTMTVKTVQESLSQNTMHITM